MNPGIQRNAKRVVLVGGGHSQIQVLKSFGMEHEPGARLTLISRDTMAPYSGMLPGLVAGHYGFEEAHINLLPLARFARCEIYFDEAESLDLEAKQVHCRNRPPVPFDLLSINVGSRPAATGVPGAETYAIPVKPVDGFLERLPEIFDRATSAAGTFRFVTVGGGAGGVELTLCLIEALQKSGGDCDSVEFHLVMDTAEILPTHNRGARARMSKTLSARNVVVHPNSRVVEVRPAEIVCEGDRKIPYDALIWVTNAAPHPWIADSGLAVDEKGFIAVDNELRSTSHPFVFAAGDTATMVHHPRAKSGVFAVRQGPILSRNLRHAVLGEPLETYRPQRQFLSLISTGDKNAVASRGPFALEGPLLWIWKDWIDRRFMAKYNELPEMDETLDGGAGEMYCAGCGSKVGDRILKSVLQEFGGQTAPDVVIGLDAPDDAAVVRYPEGCAAVHTVDFFKSFVDDPYLFGQITVRHCLGDIYAMGAAPHNALAMVTIPYGDERFQRQVLRDLLRGAVQALEEAKVVLTGGHTNEGADLAFGLSVNGVVQVENTIRKSGMQPGDKLVLSKPIGTGVVLAADMRGKCDGETLKEALETMNVSNAAVADLFRKHGVRACTDVTGFGLAGHLLEMVTASMVDVRLNLSNVPLLPRALEFAEQGIRSSLYPANAESSGGRVEGGALSAVRDLLFDPQTSGGLLGSVPADRADGLMAELEGAQEVKVAIIGEVSASSGEPKIVLT